MSVFVRRMKMPTDCGDCQLKNGSKCILTDQEIPWEWCERLDDCPLVEVPETHGRLIDAEQLKEHYAWLWPSIEHFLPQEKAVRLSRIDDAPTVIESEG